MVATDPGASSISVAVRVRPFTIREAAQLNRNDDNHMFLGDGSLAAAPTPKLRQGGIRNIVKVLDDRCLVFDPPEDNPIQKFSRSVVPNGKKTKDQTFAFDRIFDDNTTQTEVYEATTKNLLDSVLDGYNATVFAYGATGCGKTHTITGTSQMPGIIFLTMQELFEKISERSDEKQTEVSLSYLEIYNETIRDLLVPGGSKQGLMLREDSNQAVSVSGLTSHHPKDVQEVMDMIVQGNEYRTVSPTDANATSSRSHAVLQINVAQKDRNAPVNEPHTMATFSIIDLAGSERASATKNRGDRLLEGANINKSLLALGSCINALCDPRKNSHVPYRNSKLTRLLKFSLGGNCKTVMIVCISPSSVHFDETQNTLRYANRAKNIQTKVTRNVFNVNRHVKDFLVKIDEQMALINELKAQQKDAERICFVKFQKQSEKREAAVREGVQRIRTAYEHSLGERQEKVNFMVKLRSVERRIGLLSSWVAAFDTVCEAKEDEGAMPTNLVAMRKTAQGIMLELENSRYHFHQKLDKTHWERAIDGALQHSINQLPTGDGCHDNGEISSLTREAELLKSNFTREAYREVLDQDKVGDAGIMQVLLTAQFEILTSLSEILSMTEGEAVAHAKNILGRLLETGYSAASQAVKPDGSKMPIEAHPPTRRGTPKRRRTSTLPKEAVKPVPNPQLAAVSAASNPAQFLSPMKGSPRRRKANGARKGVSFTPVKRKSPVKRAVRWRDDDGESGTLADFEKTPQKLANSSPEQASPSKKPVEPTATVVAPVPPAIPEYLEEDAMDEDDSSNASLVAPEARSLGGLAAKPNRFQAGFLTKSRPSGVSGSPVAPRVSLSHASSPEPDDNGRGSPLRDLSVSKAANISSPVPGQPRRVSYTSPKAASALGSRLPTPPRLSPSDENRPPRSSTLRISNGHNGTSSSDDEGSSLIDASKLRSAIHANKQRQSLGRRTSSIGGAGAGSMGGTAASKAKRVSSMGCSGSNVLASSTNSNPSQPLSSSTNGISRLRRGSAERRRSPPISCGSPPDVSGVTKSFTPGQARRMNLSSSLRGAAGSPGTDRLAGGRATAATAASIRRTTIGGVAGAKKEGAKGGAWR